MNKAIYICASVALMLASCSDDETLELAKEKGISFSGVVGLNTRAQNIGTAELQQGKTLYVTTFKPDGERLYAETAYAYDGWVWVATPEAQTWGGNDHLSFFLTYPMLGEWETGAELTTDNKTVAVSVDQEIPQQKDYLAAYLPNVAKTQAGEAVPAHLKHLLSSVEIWAKNANGAFNYKVKGIRICGVNKQVSFDLSRINETPVPFSHPAAAAVRNYELMFDAPVALDGTARSLMGTAGNAILPPQAAGAGTAWDGTQTSADPDGQCGCYIAVLINLTAKAGASIYPAGSTANQETYGWVAVPATFGWESGKKYVYTLDFSDGAGRVDPVTPGDAVHPGTGDPQKAQPILGGLVKFGLTVTQWGQNRNDLDLKDDSKFSATVDGWVDETTGDTVLQ